MWLVMGAETCRGPQKLLVKYRELLHVPGCVCASNPMSTLLKARHEGRQVEVDPQLLKECHAFTSSGELLIFMVQRRSFERSGEAKAYYFFALVSEGQALKLECRNSLDVTRFDSQL